MEDGTFGWTVTSAAVEGAGAEAEAGCGCGSRENVGCCIEETGVGKTGV